MKYRPENQTKESRKWLKVAASIAAVIVVFILVVAGSVAYSRFRMDRVANSFLYAAAAGDTNQAYKLTSDSFKDNTSKEELEEFLMNLQSQEKYTVRSRTMSGGVGRNSRAEVVYKEPVDGSQVTLVLVNRNGDWEVEYVEASSGIQAENEPPQMI